MLRRELPLQYGVVFPVFGRLLSQCSMPATNLREPAGVEERVAMTIWKLATNVEYRNWRLFLVCGVQPLGGIVLETYHAIATPFLPRYVQVLEGEKLKEIVDGFETCWGFPQVARAIDASHVPIVHPDESVSNYCNRKGYYSIIMQDIVDLRGLFVEMYRGLPGKVHDACVFVNSFPVSQGHGWQSVS